MDRSNLEELLRAVREGETTVEKALGQLAHFPVQDLGNTHLDTQRELRCGFPEVVFGERKEPEELVEIGRAILARHGRLLVTRTTAEGRAALSSALPDCQIHPRSRAVSVAAPEAGTGVGLVLVLSAGTADAPVAEEAELTARMLGARTECHLDVGVAGLHRLLSRVERLREARALVVAAGMEGALPSVVGGLVNRPVIAVPTSVGYGASFGGLSALFAMLNSCAAGVTVVNIDNGFGAGYAAALINNPPGEGGSRMSEKRATLAVENGLVLHGRSVGAPGEHSGDLVFNTAMTGYHEILTDPSYAGQTVVMTYPQIGNYGVAEEDAESAGAWPEAFVIKEMASLPSNHRSQLPLPEWLAKNGVVSIEGVDTRQLTRLIRTAGSLRCVVSTLDHDEESLVKKAQAAQATDGRDLASVVSCRESYEWKSGYDSSYPSLTPPQEGKRHRVVAFDFGIKRNILRSLVSAGFDVTVVPAWTPADEVLAMDPAGIFLSNGPGDPAAVKPAIDSISNLIGKRPIFGICLGHQILSIVLGAQTHKMSFGHHGANHPVRDIVTGRVEITSQNHSFAVDPSSLPDDVELTHINLNDQTVEGMRHKKAPVFSVQYHPEAAPGPLDSAHLFLRFREQLD